MPEAIYLRHISTKLAGIVGNAITMERVSLEPGGYSASFVTIVTLIRIRYFLELHPVCSSVGNLRAE